MTRAEKRWLVVGILGGMLIASAIASALYWKRQPLDGLEQSQTLPIASEAPPPSPDAPRGVQLSQAEQTQIGLQVTQVQRESLVEEIVAIGRVQEPETSIATISTRFGGRVERLFVNFTGQAVQAGDPVAIITITGQPAGKDDPVSSIYSRDVIAASEEYRFALENRERAHAGARPDAVAQADALVEASRIRLERFGLTPDQINTARTTPEQPIRITVNATAPGIVRAKKVTEGQFVNAGDPLLDLTDLQSVWVKADVFDSDIARIRPGLRATITSEALPDSRLSGTVALIDAQSNPETRTTPVRIQVDNPGTRLKPGMIVQVAFRVSLGPVVTVPREAVVDSGTEKIVYVARDNGVFEQQRIQVAAPVKDRYPVTEGLKAGDRIVTRGVFLVDSQTRLTGGLTGLFGGSRSFTETSTPTPGASSTFKLTFRMVPDPPQGAGENAIHVSLTDASGKPVSDAQVRVTFTMPAMPAMNMPEMKNTTQLKWTGSEYTGAIQVMVAGGWNVGIEARRGNELLATAQMNINAR